MYSYKFSLFLFILVVFFSACRKDSMVTEVETIPPTVQENIETIINGFISDKDGTPIEGAIVSVQNETTQSNELGFFEIKGLVNEKFALIKVEKDGYFNQFETLTPSRTATDRTRIKLVEKTVSEDISATTGGTVSIGSTSSVAFQANSFVDESGNIYNGMVSVFTFFIDPTDRDIDQIMPGNLMALNADNEYNILQSFGMINVELEGENGEKLNINKAATITVDVPQTIESNAPSQIPLWYFDESSGLWHEEGTAMLEDGKYIGDVEHFTFWNCDVPSAVSIIRGQLSDKAGNSIARVRITNLSTGASFIDWTDSQGVFAGGVPRGVNLLLEVLSLCGAEVVFSENIGPFSEETVDLGLFNISNDLSFSTISGTLLGCDQSPASNGQVYFILPNQQYQLLQVSTNYSGEFTASIPTCDMDEIYIRGMDLTYGVVSEMITVLSSSIIDVGILEVCTYVPPTSGRVEFILDNGVQKVFDNCTVERTIQNSGIVTYSFIYYDILPISNDKLTYWWTIHERNNDLTNPDWSGTSVILNLPSETSEEQLYTTYGPLLGPGSGIVTVNQEAMIPGDLMQMTIGNIDVRLHINDPAGPNTAQQVSGSMIITAVLQ